MDLGDKVDPKKPSIQSAVSSPTALSNLLASFSLLVCFWFPHSVGDDTSNRPFTLVPDLMSEENAVLLLMVLWPYWFGCATLAVITTLALLRPTWFAKALLGLPIACGLGLALLWMVLLFSRAEESRSAMAMAALVAPIVACVVARMVWLYLAGQMIAAATWGQSLLCVLAIFSLRWFWFPPVTRLLWGGMLSITASILMMLASWIWVTRARHDLFDRSIDPVPFQVSLRQIILGITLTAIALTYWRVIATWV
jgi:hypothetical protein